MRLHTRWGRGDYYDVIVTCRKGDNYDVIVTLGRGDDYDYPGFVFVLLFCRLQHN